MKQKRTTCTFHCAVCDLHSSSLEAFDAHRRGGKCRQRPHDTKTRSYIVRDGICNLTKGHIGDELPAEVWGSPTFGF